MIFQNYNRFGDNRIWVKTQLIKTRDEGPVGFFMTMDDGIVVLLCLPLDRIRIHFYGEWYDFANVGAYSQDG